MTQNLLDTTTLLLNTTKSDINLNSGSKNYTETYSKGKSFNDILSTANNNYNKGSKLSSDNYKQNSSNRDFFNQGTKDLNSSKNDKINLKNYSSETNKSVQNNQKTASVTDVKDSKFATSVSSEKTSATANSSTVKSESETTVANNKSTTDLTNVSQTDVENTNLSLELNLSNMENIVEDFDGYTDLQDLNQLLMTDNLEEDIQPDFYINAFYQSTIDSLNQTTMSNVEVDVIEPLNNVLETEVLPVNSIEQINTTVQSEEALVTETLSDIKSLTDVDLKNETDVKNDTTLIDIEKNDVISDLSKNQTAEKVVKKQDSRIDELKTSASSNNDIEDVTAQSVEEDIQVTSNNKGVEVNTFTNEDNTINNDVLVNVSDDVIQEVHNIDTTKTETKTSFRDVMAKAGLDEAKLEALNLTVTESSSNSGNGANLGQSSAQEDITRMALENHGKKDSINTQNKDFSKFVDSKQVQEEQPKEISKNDILTQINNKIQAQNINGTKKITLQLSPESLGKITIEIMKGKDGLQAKMLTDNFQVKEMLERSVDGLKATLANQGVTVNNVSIKVASASESSSEFSFGRDNFNGENTQEQNFAGTGERRGDENSQYGQNSSSEFAMNEDELTELSTEDEMISVNEESEIVEEEKISVGTGNVDIEV